MPVFPTVERRIARKLSFWCGIRIPPNGEVFVLDLLYEWYKMTSALIKLTHNHSRGETAIKKKLIAQKQTILEGYSCWQEIVVTLYGLQILQGTYRLS